MMFSVPFRIYFAGLVKNFVKNCEKQKKLGKN